MTNEQGYYVTSEEMRDMLFPQAAEVWLASKAPYISPKTFHEYELNIATISKFFENFTLKSIGADAIRVYQRYRSEQCGPFSINHECSVIQQMLKRVGLWNQIEPSYQALPLPLDSVGRVLTDDERKRLFEAAQTNPNLEAAYLFALIAVNTTGGPKEITSLRLRDINLEARTITIPKEGAKNRERVRCIPLNLEAYMAVTLAINRAKRLGSLAPDHYLFPFRVRGGNMFRANYDPTKKQVTFKTAWKKILQKAGIEGRFRMYDLRHTAITTLLENPNTSQDTAEAIAGHISRRIQKRYSHVGLTARRQAVCALDGSQAPESPKNVPQLFPEDALTNSDVIEMLITDGLPPRIVEEKIKKAKNCLFDTSREALKQLRAAGVSDSVIVVMVKAS